MSLTSLPMQTPILENQRPYRKKVSNQRSMKALTLDNKTFLKSLGFTVNK